MPPEVLYGLGEPWLVGGAHPDFSWLPLAEHRVPPSADNLAALCFSACVKNLVSRGPCWDCQMLPRKYKQTNATSHFQHIGDLLDACRKANHGHGPLVLAHDAHMNHSKVTAFCMGVAATQLAADAASHPFWQLCSFHSRTMFPFAKFSHFFMISRCWTYLDILPTSRYIQVIPLASSVFPCFGLSG